MENKLELSTRLWFVLTPLACITVFGLVGNVMTLITVLNKHCKKTSFTVFLAALALTDTVVLAFTPPHVILRYILQGTSAVIMCKFFAFLGYGSRHVSVWLVVGLTLERTFAVYFPTKVKDYCVPETGLIVVAIVIVMAAAVDVHFLFGYTFTEVGNTTDCGFVSEGFEHFYHFIYPWIDLVITLILPAIVIIASNTAILVRVFNVTSAVASTTAESNIEGTPTNSL